MNLDASSAENIELKARVASLDAAAQIARRISDRQLPDQHQTDTYFVCADGRLKLREINGEQAELIWYRRPDQLGSRSSHYIRVPTDDPSGLKWALRGALGVQKVVTKHRQIFLYQNVRIHLDLVEGLGSCLEFEAVLERPEQAEQGHATLAMLQREFAIAPSDLLASSYSDLL